MKRRCAEIALSYVPEEGMIGLGGGETIGYLAEEIKKAGKRVRIVTPSAATKRLCGDLGLPVERTEDVAEIAVAFDGCDQLTGSLDALKSHGGIHTAEKIIAAMADEYILLADESKVVGDFDGTVPILLEIVKEARASLVKRLGEKGCHVRIRTECLLEVFPADRCSYAESAREMKLLPGVIETSFFEHMAKRAVIVTQEGYYIMKSDAATECNE